jgi:hypothetical protein
MINAQECLPCRIGWANDKNMQGRFCHQFSVGTCAPVKGTVTCTTWSTDSISVPSLGGTYCRQCGHTPYSTYECEAHTSQPTIEPSMVPFFEMGCSTLGYGLQINANNIIECLPCPIGCSDNNNYHGRYCRPCWEQYDSSSNRNSDLHSVSCRFYQCTCICRNVLYTYNTHPDALQCTCPNTHTHRVSHPSTDSSTSACYP